MTVAAELLFRESRAYKILVLVRNGRCDVADFVLSLARPDRNRIEALFDRCADDPQGPFGIKNDEKVKRLDGDIWELKAFSVRIPLLSRWPGQDGSHARI